MMADNIGLPPEPRSVVKNLGIYMDSSLSCETQVKMLASHCFGILRYLKPNSGFLCPANTPTYRASLGHLAS